MTAITAAANNAVRDYATAGVPSSGEHEPLKSDVRAVFAVVDAALASLGVNGAITVKKATRALLYADLAHAEDTLAVVYNDPTDALNGIYAKAGGSGSGSWAITDLALPSTFATDLAAVLAAIGEIESSAVEIEGWAQDSEAAAAAAQAAAAGVAANAASALASRNIATAKAAAADASEGAASAAADRSEEARDLILAAGLDVTNAFTTIELGVAGTTEGDAFWAPNEEGLGRYRKTGGVAVAEPGVALVSSSKVPMTRDTIAAVRTLTAPAAGKVVRTLGHYAPGDGYSRDYVFDATSTIPDTGGSVLRPASIDPDDPGRFVAATRPRFTGIAPIANVVSSAVGDYAFAGQFNGLIWGIDRAAGSGLYYSEDGVDWTAYCSTPSTGGVYRVLAADDGEVLLAVGQRTLQRSTGFTSAPGSVTWDEVFDLADQADAVGNIEHFNLDGTGHKFIVTHYSAPWPGQNWPRYGWISLDGGLTWEIKYDTQDLHGSSGNHGHMHGVTYDPWADTFYIIEGHGPNIGVYYSYDDGDNWHLIAPKVPYSNAPTVIIPTDNGLILGSDAEQQRGVLFIARPADRTNHEGMRVSFIHEVQETLLTGANGGGDLGLIGFAGVGYRDPRTGIVYIGWHTSFCQHPFITASDGVYSSTIYVEEDEIGVDPNPVIGRIYVTKDDVIGFSVINGDGTTNKDVVASVQYGLDRSRLIDQGRMWGGNARGTLLDQNSSVAVGPGSIVNGRQGVAIGEGAVAGTDNTTISSVAIGYGTRAEGSKAVAIGGVDTLANAAGSINIGGTISDEANGNNVRIGNDGDVGASAVSIGHEAGSSGFGSVAVGAAAAGQTAVGFQAEGQTSVGYQAESSVNDSVAVGQLAKATGNQAVAIGSQAETTHTHAIALGQGSVTTAADQLQIEDRHVEMFELASDPAAPATNALRFYGRDNGSGKTQFCVRFATGAVVVLGTEP